MQFTAIFKKPPVKSERLMNAMTRWRYVKDQNGKRVMMPMCWMAVHDDTCWCRENDIEADNKVLLNRINETKERLESVREELFELESLAVERGIQGL